MSSRPVVVGFLTVALCASCNSPHRFSDPAAQPALSGDELTGPQAAKSNAEPSLDDRGGREGPPGKKQDRSAVKVRQSLDEKMLFYPAPFPAGDWQPAGLKFQDVWFHSADGTRLHGWFCPVEQPRGHVLYAHGNAGNITSRAQLVRELQRLRLAVFVFDYRGYGRSEGTPTAAGAIQDSEAAWAKLAATAKIPKQDVILMGRSLGGAMAVQLAAAAPARALILESTFSSLRDIGKQHYPALAWLVSRHKLNSVAQIVSYRGPLFQSHGDADKTIPISLGRKLHAAARGGKTFHVVQGGDHNSPQGDAYYAELKLFLDGLPAASN